MNMIHVPNFKKWVFGRALIFALSALCLPLSTWASGFLGVEASSIPDSIRAQVDLEEDVGVVIRAVVEQSAAEAAGLEKYDLLLGMNGEVVDSYSTFSRILSRSEAGESLRLSILRSGEPIELTAVLTTRKAVRDAQRSGKPAQAPEAPKPPQAGQSWMSGLNLDFQGISEEEKESIKMAIRQGMAIARHYVEEVDTEVLSEENIELHLRAAQAALKASQEAWAAELRSFEEGIESEEVMVEEIEKQVEQASRAQEEAAKAFEEAMEAAERARERLAEAKEATRRSASTTSISRRNSVMELENATVIHSTDTGTITLQKSDGKVNLMATDASGATLYDGPLNTAEDRERVPPSVIQRLEHLEAAVQLVPAEVGLDPSKIEVIVPEPPSPADEVSLHHGN